MQIIYCNAAALTIAITYYIWRDGIMAHRLREKRLRERVAYMLWLAANQLP